MTGDGLILEDEYIQAMKTYLETMGAAIDDMLTAYNAILCRTAAAGLAGGETAVRFLYFTGCTEQLSPMAKTVTEEIGRMIDSFCREVEAEDQITLEGVD